MDLGKKYFFIISIILIFLIPPHIILGLFNPINLDFNTMLLICIIYDICFLTTIFYLHFKGQKKSENLRENLRYSFYLRGKIHIIIVPYLALSFFLSLLFYTTKNNIGIFKSFLVSSILGFIIAFFILTTFFVLIKKREKQILKEFEEIDRQSQKILKDLEKFEKLG